MYAWRPAGGSHARVDADTNDPERLETYTTTSCPKCDPPAQVLTGLMDLASAAVAPLPAPGSAAMHVAMDLEDRVAVVEGLARVVAGLPAASASGAGLHLIQPLVLRAQSLAHAGTCAAHFS